MKKRKDQKRAPRRAKAFLYYWRNCFSDTKRNKRTHKFNWASRLRYGAFEELGKNDLIWAITRVERGKYGLAAKFIVANFGVSKNARTGKWDYFF